MAAPTPSETQKLKDRPDISGFAYEASVVVVEAKVRSQHSDRSAVFGIEILHSNITFRLAMQLHVLRHFAPSSSPKKFCAWKSRREVLKTAAAVMKF